MTVLRQEFGQIELLQHMDPVQGKPFPWLHDHDRNQAALFNALMQESDAAFAWAARGGYGILRWADRVNWAEISEKSPVVTGFSDVTVLHSALNSRGIKSVHGPMLCTLPYTSRASRQALLNCFLTGNFPDLEARQVVYEGESVRARLAGGNLCCLSHLAGTPWEPVWDGSILFIEDVNEPLYRIDRMLTHLLQSGRLSGAVGIVLGEFTQCGESETMLADLFRDRLQGLRVPVISGLPAGHGTDNMPLLMGGEYLLEPSECRLTPLESLA